MKTVIEFRIPEKYAKEFLSAETGVSLMGFIRKVRVPDKSEMYEKIGKYYRLVLKRDHNLFFLGWSIQRYYYRKELETAQLLLLKLTKTFEPAGIECGTIYDNQFTCDICGTGIRQVSELVLDLRKVPRNTDIARTISDEIIISQELAEFLNDNKMTGFELKAVHHKSPKYRKKPWFQLFNTSFVNVNPITKTGNDPFDEDESNEYRCQNGHTIGLNILSELSIYRDSWDGNDIVATMELFGVNRGLLRTYPLLMVSQRLYRLLMKEKFKGFTVEVVRLVL